MSANFIVSGQEMVEAKNWKLLSMVKVTLLCVSGEREEKRRLEAKLATTKEQAASTQDSIDKLTASMAMLEKSLSQL